MEAQVNDLRMRPEGFAHFLRQRQPRLLCQHPAQMGGAGGFLVHPLLRQRSQAMVDLCRGIAAAGGIGIHRAEHAHDPAAFLTFPAGIDPLTFLVAGVTGHLVRLQVRVTFDQDGHNQEFGKLAQKGKLG